MNKYGGGTILNLGSATLKITYRGRSTLADFKIVHVPNSPSILECKQALERANHVERQQHERHASCNSPYGERSDVLKSYGDCFEKIAKFLGEKYKTTLIEDAMPVVHAPRTVPVHIMPFYKAELDNMLANGIISPVTEPTDWVNSIVANIKVTPKEKKICLCLDTKDLNKNIKR